jgi:hypothetical protein
VTQQDLSLHHVRTDLIAVWRVSVPDGVIKVENAGHITADLVESSGGRGPFGTS